MGSVRAIAGKGVNSRDSGEKKARKTKAVYRLQKRRFWTGN
jgi:hypothetical protein